MNKDRGLKHLLNNNLFLAVASLILAFVVWLGYSVYGGEVQEKTLDSVPVTFDSQSVPKQFNLEAFGDYTDSIQVVVSGRKSAVGTATSSDIRVVANTSGVTTAGKKTLQLSVTSTNPDIDIVSFYPLYVEVYFDSYAEAQIDLDINVTGLQNPGKGYRLGRPTLSETKVTASGPATEVNKIAKIQADVVVEDKITTTTTFDTTIVPLDEFGNEIQNITIDGVEDIKLTIPVYKKARLPVKVDFTNVPSGIDISQYVRYSVSSLAVEAEESTIDSINSVTLGSVDFTTLSNTKKSFDFSTENLSGIIVTDSTKKVTVFVDLSAFSSKTIVLPTNSITVSNPTDFKASITSKPVRVTVIGKREELLSLKASDFSANLSISKKAKAGDLSKDLAIAYTGKGSCWVYGTYAVNYTLK